MNKMRLMRCVASDYNSRRDFPWWRSSGYLQFLHSF